VFEQVMTDTARYADVILPNTTFLEGYDLVRSYGPWTLSLGKPVIEPIGEARSNAEMFGELLHRTGVADEGDRRGELEEMLDVIERLPKELSDQVRDCGRAAAPFDGRPVQFLDVWPRTPDRKVDLFPDALDRASPTGLYSYQLDPSTREFPL